MGITDLPFIFVFLPASVIIYYILPKRIRKVSLIPASLVFYSCFSLKYTVLLFAAMLVNVLLAVVSDRLESGAARKALLAVGVAMNVSLLCFYKYCGAVLSLFPSTEGSPLRSLTLHLGISFFTFKAISLLADVYKRRICGIRPVQAATYMIFFGQIVSGPLSRYGDFGTEKRFDFDLFSSGLLKYAAGFSKKILIANMLSRIVTEVYGTAETSTSYLWLGSVCYSLYLFFDFSGYSDMAIGIGNLFGFRCDKNFDYPYMTGSLSEFWRRWHISLGKWFRDYVYIPLGGSRVGTARLLFNLFAVWILTGIWHGSTLNFIVWGMSFFVMISFEKLTGFPAKRGGKVSKALYRAFSLIFINFTWVIFNSETLRRAASYIKGMIVFRAIPIADQRTLILLRENAVFIAAAILLCFPVLPYLRKKLEGRKSAPILDAAVCVAALALFVISLSFIISGQNNPFAYANF